MNFYIPKKVPEVFLRDLGYRPAERVPVQPLNGGGAIHCLDNVRKYLSCNDGEPQFGWMFSMLGRFILKLHAHVVVSLPEEKLLCITPPEKPALYVNFSRDSSIPASIINSRLPTKSFALVKAPIIRQFVQLENDADTARLLGDVAAISEIDMQKAMLASEFVAYVSANTGRNDVCYCGSAKKHKHCCG